MSGIAGYMGRNTGNVVPAMLDALEHRGGRMRRIVQKKGVTLGVTHDETGFGNDTAYENDMLVEDRRSDDHFALAELTERGLKLERDLLGVVPLYYGLDESGGMYFASEVKALLPYISKVKELLPAHSWLNGVVKSAPLEDRQDQIRQTAKDWAGSLRHALEVSIQSMLQPGFGSWLSGGLDSSAIAAIARPYTDEMHTFAAGVAGATDLEYGRIVADHIGSIHHEMMVDLNILQQALPQVIFHLESFDPLLVRSSITNYLVAELSAQFVPVVFSGEGGDELFAGYEYLKEIPETRLESELEDITSRLHNTALQRVDRCASAHGLQALVPFLHPLVLEQAHSIPVEYKIVDGVEKWILRHAVADLLPESVAWRPKAKFWEGAGVTDLLAQCAENSISDADYRRERILSNSWQLHSKEELLYYRIFKEHFGEMESLDWMGRTKGSPLE